MDLCFKERNNKNWHNQIWFFRYNSITRQLQTKNIILILGILYRNHSGTSTHKASERWINNDLGCNRYPCKCQSLSKPRNQKEMQHYRTAQSYCRLYEEDMRYTLLARSVPQCNIHSCEWARKEWSASPYFSGNRKITHFCHNLPE